MPNYQIITDSACDLPGAVLEKLNVSIARLSVLFRGENLPDNVDDGIKTIYDGLRAGEAATTSAVNPDGWAAAMEPPLAAGQDILVLTFSSALSNTCQSAQIAAKELSEKYPQRKIRVVDTLCAALGQGLLVWYACQKRDQGMDLDALAQWVEDTKLHICHWVTVDDLMYLKRGGRVSGTTAVVGTMLNIKPIIHLNEEGKLLNVGKVRGRKAAIDLLAKKLGELGSGYENDTVFITHGDCPEDAGSLARRIQELYGIKEVMIGNLGAVIGSHAGPGTLALFFLGKHR